MGKMKVNNSTHMITKPKRRLQEYFDPSHNGIATPNQRSLPKYKNFFDKPRGKSQKKDQVKRGSNGKMGVRKQKQNFSPPKMPKSGQKISRYDQSIGRQYDSPSKDHEEIDFIFKGAQKKMKGNSLIENTIQNVNENLKANRLSQAINVLTETLRVEQNNFDLIYLLGICYIFNASYEQAIHIFQGMLKGKPKKNIYLLLSVCYKKTEKFQQTEQILEECIDKFPKYYEAYIYRGKLYLKLKEFKYALQDFDRAIAIDPKKQIAYVGKGDCLRLIERYEQARKMYTDAFNSKKNNISLLLRRAICSMELKKYEAALQDINHLLQSDFQNSEALYFKGLIFNKLKKPNDAIICYEQAIKFNTNKRAVTRAIYEITKIKIENRDYYEALYTLQRAQYLDIDEKVIKKFKIFINGVTSMMKKNYEEGVRILTELAQDKDKPLSNFIKPLFYSTRSYGYMALYEFHKAKEDLDNMESQFSLDLPNLYNKFICEGILACNNSKFEHALTLFSKAAKALPYRIQPAFYKAVTLICFSTKILPKELKDKKKEYLQSAMRTINKVETIQNNPSLFMIRGLLHYALGELDSGLNDFDKCLNQSTKPNPLIFYLIGMIFAETGRLNEAISQFKRAIENDKDHHIPEAILNLAKCMLLTGEINTSFNNLQTYMSYRPSSPQIHIWAGHLLFYINAYEDAAKAYSNINNVNKNFQVLLYKAKCYLACKDVLNTLANLKLMLEIKNDDKILFDYEMLECLRECSDQNISEYESIRLKMKEVKKKTNGSFGIIFNEFDYQFYKAVTYFYDRRYPQASKNFKRALDLIQKDMNSPNPPLDQQFYYDYKKLSFTNRSFNYFEIVYNMAISDIMFGNHLKAYKALNSLLQLFPEDQTRLQFAKFVALVQMQTKDPFNSKSSKKDIEEIQFISFPVENRLCSIFPESILPFKTHVRTRLFFCLPYVEKPDITPRFQQKILQEFSMHSIEIKPEAPWIRRSDQGVIFTDQVIKYDIQLSQSSSSQSQKTQEEQDDYVQNAEELFEQGQHFNREDLSEERYGNNQQQQQKESNKRMTANQLKQFFKLDKMTEQKLAKYKK